MPPKNSKKKKSRYRAVVEDDARVEIGGKIGEQKLVKANSKSLFTRRKTICWIYKRSSVIVRFEIPEQNLIKRKRVLSRI